MTGYKRDLVRDDLWSIEESESSEFITKKLETAWCAVSTEYVKNVKNMPDEVKSPIKKKKTDKNGYKSDAKNNEEEIKLTVKTKITKLNYFKMFKILGF